MDPSKSVLCLGSSALKKEGPAVGIRTAGTQKGGVHVWGHMASQEKETWALDLFYNSQKNVVSIPQNSNIEKMR